MTAKRWRVRVDGRSEVFVEAWPKKGAYIPCVAVATADNVGTATLNFDANNVDRLDALIEDLIAARTFVWGQLSASKAAVTDTVDVRPLIASLKELTQSRSEFARCEKALEVLGGTP